MPNELTYNSDSIKDFEGVVLRSIDAKTHFPKDLGAAEYTKKNADLEDKLIKVSEEHKHTGTSEYLDKDKI